MTFLWFRRQFFQHELLMKSDSYCIGQQLSRRWLPYTAKNFEKPLWRKCKNFSPRKTYSSSRSCQELTLRLAIHRIIESCINSWTCYKVWLLCKSRLKMATFWAYLTARKKFTLSHPISTVIEHLCFGSHLSPIFGNIPLLLWTLSATTNKFFLDSSDLIELYRLMCAWLKIASNARRPFLIRSYWLTVRAEITWRKYHVLLVSIYLCHRYP
jgi:hypothetical protein